MISFTKLSENHILDKIFHNLMINIMFDFHEIHIRTEYIYIEHVQGKKSEQLFNDFFPPLLSMSTKC